MASVYSGAGDGRYGTVTVKGQVEFGMQYNYKQGALEVYVAQCKDLAAVDAKRNRSDPYVKVCHAFATSNAIVLNNNSISVTTQFCNNFWFDAYRCICCRTNQRTANVKRKSKSTP